MAVEEALRTNASTGVAVYPWTSRERVSYLSMPAARHNLLFNLSAPLRYEYPDGAATVASGAYLVASPPAATWVSSEGPVALLSLRLGPLAAARLFGLRGEGLAERVVAASDLGSPALKSLASAVLGAGTFAKALAILRKELARHVAGPEPDQDLRRCDAALRALGGNEAGAAVRRAAAEAGLSEVSLRRLFRERAGLSPKRLARLARFERLRAALRGGAPDWFNLVLSCGYHDQAHLIHEFREFSGMSPGDYLRLVERTPEHVPARPAPLGPFPRGGRARAARGARTRPLGWLAAASRQAPAPRPLLAA